MKKLFTKQKRQMTKTRVATFLILICGLSSKAQTVYGTMNNTLLVTFNAPAPAAIISSVTITGMTTGQTIEGLDSRPNTGELYAFGYNKITGLYQLYTINKTTGAASALNTATNIALGNGPIGFDFNPTVDRIRVVSANGGNFRLHPVTGLIAAVDGTLTYAAGDVNVNASAKIVAGAYINSYIGAATTALYDYDNLLNVVALQNPPNNGSLTTIGTSGIITDTNTPMVDMDIFYDGPNSINKAYLMATTSTNAGVGFYTLNTATGMATLVGMVGTASPISNIAVMIDRTAPAMMGQMAYGISGTNLISFDTQNPQFISTINTITGVTAGQTLVGMDFRPATNTLYALGYDASNNNSQLYTINTTSAIASAVNTQPVALMLGTVSVGFDFNPTVDKIRVVSNNGSNYRLDPTTGTITATDATLNYAAGDVNTGASTKVGTVAYTNSYNTATATTLYNYDEALNILTTQAPPNNGTLNTIGSSGIMVNSADPSVDMDIYYDQVNMVNVAYLSANTSTETIDRLYTVNLTTGMATVIGKIGFGIPVRDIAIQTMSLMVTGISNSENNTALNLIKIYPNPLMDRTIIDLKSDNVASIQILDVTGRVIETALETQKIDTGSRFYWNTSDLQNGFYFVNVKNTDGSSVSVKVVK